MKKWTGSSAVCINANNEILMVKQGKPEEVKKWSIPSGGRETGETYEQCCQREVEEETGYIVKVGKILQVKSSVDSSYQVKVHYYECEIIGGQATIQDPDELIYEIAWQSKEAIKKLDLSFPEDREFLINYIEENEN